MTKRKEDHKDETTDLRDMKDQQDAADRALEADLKAKSAEVDARLKADREREQREGLTETRKMAKVGDVPRGEVNAAIREGARRHAERWNPAGRQLSPAEQALVDRGEAVTVYTLLCELERRALANVDVVLGDLRAARELVGPSPQVVG